MYYDLLGRSQLIFIPHLQVDKRKKTPASLADTAATLTPSADPDKETSSHATVPRALLETDALAMVPSQIMRN